MNLIKKYEQFILNPDPSKLWKSIRFVLHWLTLPLKLIVIGSLMGYQIISKSLKQGRAVPEPVDLETRRTYFKSVFDRLPLFNTNEITLYTNRVPYYSVPNGYNHNPDHQCARHSTFSFLMSKLDIRSEKIDKATWMHMQGQWLARGYNYHPEHGLTFNAATTSGDMLCGLNLAVLTTQNEMVKEKFDQLVTHVVDNDYSLLEGASPGKEDAGYELYNKLLKQAGYRQEAVRMKSARGMWQPGLETVGAQALTILAALKLADKKLGNVKARKAYRKLLWKYGYGLLSLFPTAYIDSKRGYFNDHNCLIALYVLSKLSESKFSRLFWKIPMVLVWRLSVHWYNGYFTGLLNNAHPGTVSPQYIQDCVSFLYEEKPRSYGIVDTELKTVDFSEQPVTYNDLDEDEFSPDVPMDRETKEIIDNNKVKAGLGFIAAAILLEDDPKRLLE